MGLFDSLFGISKKQNISDLIPEPPRMTLAGGSVEGLVGGTQGLIDVFQRRSQGQDAFDFLRFVFEPQLNRLNQAFGRGFIGEEGMGSLGRRQGALGSLEADLQRRGLLDSGVSGVLQGQLEAERAAKEAELYGQARTMQRADIDASLQNLNQLYPQLFQAKNIPNQVEYQNAMNSYNALLQRNQATQAQRDNRAQQTSNAIMGGIGLGLAPFTGGASLSMVGTGGFQNLFASRPATIAQAPMTASQGVDMAQQQRVNNLQNSLFNPFGGRY